MVIGDANNQLLALRRAVLQWTDASLPDDFSYAGSGLVTRVASPGWQLSCERSVHAGVL